MFLNGKTIKNYFILSFDENTGSFWWVRVRA
jgi:hypothetical protein